MADLSPGTTEVKADRKRFVFIGGCALSGTSALRQVITADQDAVVGLERFGGFISRPAEFTPELYARDRFFDLRDGDTFLKTLDEFPYYRQVEPRYAAARVVGDKIPSLFKLYGRLATSFPGVRIVYVV